jgi:hypothetical protein
MSSTIEEDKEAIREVRRAWAFARDLGEWDRLAQCFHTDASITVSWYSGSAAGFVQRSREMGGQRRPEERNKHWLGNMRAEVQGTRATLETDVNIVIREHLDGYLFDYLAWSRFYDLFEKRDGVWRIFKMSCIYDKDRLDPVIPGSVPASFYDSVPLSGLESGFAFMRFRQTKKGRTVPPGIILGDSPGEAELKAEGARWLQGG